MPEVLEHGMIHFHRLERRQMVVLPIAAPR